MILGAILGLAAAGLAGHALGSWLVFALCALPLTVVGGFCGLLVDMARYERRVADDPASVEAMVESLVQAGQRRQAGQALLMASKSLQSAARERGRPDRAELEARAARWESRAKQLIQQDVSAKWGAFRAFRARRERDGGERD